MSNKPNRARLPRSATGRRQTSIRSWSDRVGVEDREPANELGEASRNHGETTAPTGSPPCAVTAGHGPSDTTQSDAL